MLSHLGMYLQHIKLNINHKVHYTLGLPDPGLPECRINRPKAMSPAYFVVSMMLNHPSL